MNMGSQLLLAWLTFHQTMVNNTAQSSSTVSPVALVGQCGPAQRAAAVGGLDHVVDAGVDGPLQIGTPVGGVRG